MTSRVKEDEKNERIIRNLLKLPENRRCINCNSLGPQYVCTNFWTFVCTNCSGIHREFTHRVKSISIAKFTSQEVASLQGGGNARAKDVYFKELDSQGRSFPDSSNVEKLRDFIKHVYVDRRYTGEKSFDKPPRAKMNEPEDSYVNKRNDTYQGGSRSPTFEDGYDRRYGDKPSPGGRNDDRNFFDGRSPGYQENRQYGDFRKSPARAEVVNDWRREDRFVNGRRTEDTKSPDRQRDVDVSSPPIARPVREILGENVSPLRIEPPKDNGSVRTQRSVSSSSLASSNGNPPEMKNENLGSLIDFNTFADPPPPPQTQPAVPDKSTEELSTSANVDNWACFDSVPSTIVSSAPSNANALETVLSQLSAPTSIAVPPTAPPPGKTSASNFGSNFQAISSPPNNSSVFPPSYNPLAASGVHTSHSGVQSTDLSNNFVPFPGLLPGVPSNTVNSHVTVTGSGQWSGMPFEQYSSFPASGNLSAGQSLFVPPVGGSQNNQPWNSFNVPTAVASSSVSDSLPTSVSVPVTSAAQSSSTEPKCAPRNELPQDLFTPTYPSYVAMPGWQTAMHPGFGVRMQYNNAMHMTQPQLSKSSNPFDLNAGAPSPQFPAMGSLQAAMPNLAPPSYLLPTSSTDPSLSMWAPQSSSVPHVQTFLSSMRPSALMTQSVHNNTPMSGRPLGGVMGFDVEARPTIGSSNPDQQHQQQLGGIYLPPTAANPFPNMGGNPFG